MSYLDSRLCVQLYIRFRAVMRCHEANLKPLGITYPQALVLLVLDEEKSCCIDVIGSRLCLDIGTLSPLLKKMEKKDLVLKERDQQDERKVFVRLSTQGQELIPSIKIKFQETAEKTCLPPHIVQEMMNCLNMIKLKD